MRCNWPHVTQYSTWLLQLEVHHNQGPKIQPWQVGMLVPRQGNGEGHFKLENAKFKGSAGLPRTTRNRCETNS